jgi:hypothetical protein
MSDPRKPPDLAARAGQIDPVDSPKTEVSRKTPKLQVRDEDDEPPQGPNLVIAFSIMALALLAAIAAAALIVWPFYKGR